METKRTHTIIRSFFGKHFSKETQLRFRFWLRMEEDKEEKEEMMEDIWQESPSVVSGQTWNDLSEIRQRIAVAQRKAPVLRYQLLRQWSKYAAVVALVVTTAVVTHLLNHPSVEIVSPKMAEIYVPYGECRQVQLPDGTSVWVNAGSLLVYPSEFMAGTRTVYLSGEARFEVVKNPDKPFIVSTNHLDVQALGTVFSVDAYPNSPTTSATLEAGSIRVDGRQGVQVSSILKPDEQLVYLHQTGQFSVHKVEAGGISAWKDGYLVFENASFEELVNALERKYNVTINYNARKYQGSFYFVKFNPSESVEDAMLVLSRLIDGFHYTITGQTISIN